MAAEKTVWTISGDYLHGKLESPEDYNAVVKALQSAGLSPIFHGGNVAIPLRDFPLSGGFPGLDTIAAYRSWRDKRWEAMQEQYDAGVEHPFALDTTILDYNQNPHELLEAIVDVLRGGPLTKEQVHELDFAWHCLRTQMAREAARRAEKETTK